MSTASATPGLGSTHTHRWRISEQNGDPFVPGMCQGCGAERMFKSAFDEDALNDRRSRACMQCGYLARSPFALVRHLQKHQAVAA